MFQRMLKRGKTNQVELRQMNDVDMPAVQGSSQDVATER